MELNQRQQNQLQLLTDACVVFDKDDEMPPGIWIDLNDAFFWGCSDLKEVKPDELERVYNLFLRYGMCGVYYWVAERRGGKEFKAEFKDVNRKIEFVRNEENLINSCKSDTEYAYKDATYTLG